MYYIHDDKRMINCVLRNMCIVEICRMSNYEVSERFHSFDHLFILFYREITIAVFVRCSIIFSLTKFRILHWNSVCHDVYLLLVNWGILYILHRSWISESSCINHGQRVPCLFLYPLRNHLIFLSNVVIPMLSWAPICVNRA